MHFKILTLSLGLFVVVADAQSVVQTVFVEHTDSYTNAAPLIFDHVDSNFFSGTFQPFDSDLGTLDSFVIAYDLSNLVTGTTPNGAGISASFNGPISVGGIIYASDGNGYGAAGLPGTFLSGSVPVSDSRTFLVAQAGITYNPAILNVVTGASAFDWNYSGPFTVNVFFPGTVDVASGGTISFTYNYTPAAIPEPSSFAVILGGLALAGTALRRRR